MCLQDGSQTAGGASEGVELGAHGVCPDTGVPMSGPGDVSGPGEERAAPVAVVRPMPREAAADSERTIVVKGNNTLKDLFLYFLISFYILYALV